MQRNNNSTLVSLASLSLANFGLAAAGNFVNYFRNWLWNRSILNYSWKSQNFRSRAEILLIYDTVSVLWLFSEGYFGSLMMLRHGKERGQSRVELMAWDGQLKRLQWASPDLEKLWWCEARGKMLLTWLLAEVLVWKNRILSHVLQEHGHTGHV